MNRSSSRTLDLVAAAGLGVGAILGMAGTLVADASMRQVLWGIDGVGLVVAAALLMVKFLRRGDDCVAAGFLVFAIGESLLVSGTAAGLAGSVPSFAGGVALWAAGLMLISVPKVFASWIRTVGVFAAILFAIVAARMLWGDALLPTSSPLPFLAYPFVVLTFVGWASALVKTDGI